MAAFMHQPKEVHQKRVYSWQVYTLALILSGFVFSVFPSTHAEEHYRQRRRPPLSTGMTTSEVLQIWGAPSAKQELETQRQEKWFYQGAEVTFEQGQLVKWESGPAQPAPLPASVPTLEAEEKTAPSQAEALLSEILRDVPAEGDSPARATPGAARELAPQPGSMESHLPGMWRGMPSGPDIESD